MYRRMKLHLKTGVVIFAFSLLVTAVFAGGLLWFRTDAGEPTAAKGVYALYLSDYMEMAESSGLLRMEASRLRGASDYEEAVQSKTLERLLPVSLFFLAALFALSICLWSVLKRMQKNQIMLIAAQLNNVMAGLATTEDPVLIAAYDEIKQKFDIQLSDYKRLSAYLTHEQKNAIAILRTNLELSDNREYLKNLDDIADSIDDILTLSESADMSPMATVDVSVICAEVYDVYRKTSDNIAFDFDGDENTEIIARSRWIYRAVANLLDNAIKYGMGKPVILSARAKHNSVIVSVADNGVGIEETKQESIFSDRYRVNELNRDGYGIGLSLVSHVCDLCDGFVTVDSEPGKGSTFYLSFPQKLF